MKTKIFTFVNVLLLILLVQSESFSQWHTQSFSNINNNNLRRVQFLNSLTGYACGGHGVFMKTVDGGDTWSVVNAGTPFFISGMHFFDVSTGLLGTDDSKVLKTTNGGASFTSFQLPAGSGFSSDFHFNNANTGYLACGGNKMFKTIDGGSTWSQIADPYFSCGQIQFFNNLIGYTIVKDSLKKTFDAGVTWANVYIPGKNQAMWFHNQYTGWVTGTNFVSKTTDAGYTWVQSPLPIEVPFGIKFIDANTGWCVGFDNTKGTICKTIDGGATWTTEKIVTGNKFYEISIINSNKLWVSGNALLAFTDNATSISQTSVNTPDKFEMKQNYPNPFNPATKINFDMKKSGFASLVVYDNTGREVQTLVNENLNVGSYSVDFNAGNLTSGVYFYTLTTSDFRETKKMTLVK